MTLEEAKGKIAQAYQVNGIFARAISDDMPPLKITSDEMLRALDYFAADHFDPDFLPWPKNLAGHAWAT